MAANFILGKKLIVQCRNLDWHHHIITWIVQLYFLVENYFSETISLKRFYLNKICSNISVLNIVCRNKYVRNGFAEMNSNPYTIYRKSAQDLKENLISSLCIEIRAVKTILALD